MKTSLLVAGVGGILLSAQALAATYGDACPSCTGTPQGASWYAAATNIAITYNAQENDFIEVCRDNGSGTAVVARYVVVQDPVTSASDLQWIQTQGNVGVTCADLGYA